MKIIINADDLGLSDVVNRAIDEAFCKNRLSSSTILANSDSLDQVKSIVAKYDKKSFGIHLNLTQGKPMSDDSIFRKYGIVNSKGVFDKQTSMQKCPNANDELKAAIAVEWDAQIKHLLNEGIELSHADGHHHCHTWSGLTDVLVHVLMKNNINKVRNMYHYPVVSLRELFKAVTLQTLTVSPFSLLSNDIPIFSSYIQYKQYKKILSRSGLITTQFFGQYQVVEQKMKNNQGIHNGVMELMCHPGHIKYEDETKSLLAPDSFFIASNMELISYNDL